MYCEKRGLNVHTLWYWSARMQDEKRPTSKASKAGAELRMALVRPTRSVEVTAAPATLAAPGVRLRVGAVHVEVDRGFDGETLMRVLHVLDQRGAAR